MLRQYRSTGDLEILGALYEPYMVLVYGVCYKYLQDEAKSQDAVMQVFEELITKLRVHEVSHFKSWLHTLARNTCLMQLRKESKNLMLSIEEEIYTQEDGLDFPISDDRSESEEQEARLTLMESCLSELRQEQETCVRLFYLEQRCYKEIADITGYDILKVKSHIQNGKRNLKICMERKDND